jgi:hypothetical protein
MNLIEKKGEKKNQPIWWSQAHFLTNWFPVQSQRKCILNFTKMQKDSLLLGRANKEIPRTLCY